MERVDAGVDFMYLITANLEIGYIGRGTQISDDCASLRYKDVQGFEEEFLVGRYEARDCNICITVYYLSASQGRASETTWIVATVTCSSMEMETYIYRFCGWIAKVSTKSRCNMDYQLTKMAHFVAYSMTYSVKCLKRLYI